MSSAAGASAEAERRAAAEAERRRDFELNSVQYDFVYDDESTYCAYIGGIGGGKSFAGALKALRRATKMPGSLGMVGAPTYTMLRDATLRSVFQVFPRALVKKWNQTEGLMALHNGSEILFRSTDDPERLRGPNLAWAWLDEAPLCGYYAWKILKGRLRQSGFEPQAWITGSPKGEDEFYEDFEHAPLTGHRLYRASTRDNAHNLPPDFIESLGYSGAFAQQEIEGLFVAFEGLVYEFRPEWHLAEWDETRTDAHGRLARATLRIGGIDWGFTNPAVALPVWVDGDDRAWVRDEFYRRQAGYAGVADAAVDFSRRYRIATWYCGPDEPEHIADLNARFAREGLSARAVAAADDITPGIETVRRQLAPRRDGTAGLVLSARCAQTRAEFRTYAYPSEATTRGKRDPQEKPVKRFDHALDALRYCLHSALGPKTRHHAMPDEAVEPLHRRDRVSEIGGVTVRKRVF